MDRHSQTHNDITPQNFLVKFKHGPTDLAQIEIVLTDFGMADSDSKGGTPIFASPECFEKKERKSDIFFIWACHFISATDEKTICKMAVCSYQRSSWSFITQNSKICRPRSITKPGFTNDFTYKTNEFAVSKMSFRRTKKKLKSSTEA